MTNKPFPPGKDGQRDSDPLDTPPSKTIFLPETLNSVNHFLEDFMSKNGNCEPKNPVSVSLPMWLDDLLSEYAKQNFKSKSDIVGEALRQYFLTKNDNLETFEKLYPDKIF